MFPIIFQKVQKLINGGRGGGGGSGLNKIERGVYLGRQSTWSVEKKVETRLKGSKQFGYYFVSFPFDMHYSFFIGSGSFAIVGLGVYDSTLIVLKKLHDCTSSDFKKRFA